jgi:hypothetical protein
MNGQLILIALGCQIRFPFIAQAVVIAHRRFNYALSHFVLVPAAIYDAGNGKFAVSVAPGAQRLREKLALILLTCKFYEPLYCKSLCE